MNNRTSRRSRARAASRTPKDYRSESEVPQLLRPSSSARSTPSGGRADIAVYRLAAARAEGQRPVIAFETAAGVANVARDAAFSADVPLLELEPELDRISEFAHLVLEKLRGAQPGSVQVEFGVELGGKVGIPLVTQGEAKANLKVILKWSATKDEDS
jgi:hypothetical protein